MMCEDRKFMRVLLLLAQYLLTLSIAIANEWTFGHNHKNFEMFNDLNGVRWS